MFPIGTITINIQWGFECSSVSASVYRNSFFVPAYRGILIDTQLKIFRQSQTALSHFYVDSASRAKSCRNKAEHCSLNNFVKRQKGLAIIRVEVDHFQLRICDTTSDEISPTPFLDSAHRHVIHDNRDVPEVFGGPRE